MKTFKSAPEDKMIIFAGEVASIPESITQKYSIIKTNTDTSTSTSTSNPSTSNQSTSTSNLNTTNISGTLTSS